MSITSRFNQNRSGAAVFSAAIEPSLRPRVTDGIDQLQSSSSAPPPPPRQTIPEWQAAALRQAPLLQPLPTPLLRTRLLGVGARPGFLRVGGVKQVSGEPNGQIEKGLFQEWALCGRRCSDFGGLANGFSTRIGVGNASYLRILVGLAARRLQRLLQRVPRRGHRLPGLGRRRVAQRARVLRLHRRSRRQVPQTEQFRVGVAGGHPALALM